MSAPIENFAGELKVEKCEDVPEELDLTSPKLDPLKALYSENMYLPFENPTKFNNLAEYENVVIRGNTLRSRGRVRGGRGRIKQDNAARSRVISLPTQIKNEDSGDTTAVDEAKARLQARRKKMNRNVLNRMTSFEEGPMTLLRRAVEEQLRVKVWTRSAVTRRGYCIAFVIAFDKHFNLALMDVDETYRIPKTVRKPVTDTARKTSRHKSENAPPDNELSSLPEARKTSRHKSENAPLDNELSSLPEVSERLTDSKFEDGKSVTKLTYKDTESVNKPSQNVSDSEDTDSSVSKLTQKLSIKHSIDSGDSVTSKSTRHRNTFSKTSQSADILSTKISDIATTQTDIETQEQFQNIPQISKQETNVSEKKGEDPEFITEVEYKIKHRHVNQLFVRGDNVVSIVLLD